MRSPESSSVSIECIWDAAAAATFGVTRRDDGKVGAEADVFNFSEIRKIVCVS